MTTTTAITVKPPVPPFTDESAILKVRLAENAWNSRDPQAVAQGYSIDSVWRNRSVFVTGRAQIIDFLGRQVEPRTRVPPHQRVVGAQRGPHRGPFCLRVS